MIRSARHGLAPAGDIAVYTDQAALEAHRATLHHAVWRAVAETLDGPPEATRCTTVFPEARADWGQP